MNVDTGEFRALTAEVGTLRAEVASLRETVDQVRFSKTYLDMCVVMARAEGVQEGQSMVRDGRRASRGRRPSNLRAVPDERRSS
jgi:hypothetical protein